MYAALVRRLQELRANNSQSRCPLGVTGTPTRRSISVVMMEGENTHKGRVGFSEPENGERSYNTYLHSYRIVIMYIDTGDRRAQSILIGIVLVAGIAVAALVLVQLTAVPTWNAAIEYEHSTSATGDMHQLREGVVESGSLGRARSVEVSLSPTYPNRGPLYNLPDPTGTIETRELGTVTIDGSVALDRETQDYWNGSEVGFQTGALGYQTKYNEFQPSPIRWIEHGVLFNIFPDANVSLTDHRLIDDRTIQLLFLQGELSTTGAGSTSVDVEPVSAPWRTVAVTTPPGQPLRLQLPTSLSEDQWTGLLTEERQENGGYIESVDHTVIGDGLNRLELAMVPNETYRLRLAAVGVGDRIPTVGAHYLTADAGNVSVPESRSVEVTAEVRDRYNNPVTGTGVNFSLDGPGSLSDTEAVSDGSGEASVIYTAPDVDGSGETIHINASFTDDPSDPGFDPRLKENVRFATFVINTDGSGTGGGGTGDELNPQGPDEIELVDAIWPGNKHCLVEVTLRNDFGQTVEPERVRLPAHSAASPGASSGTGVDAMAIEDDENDLPADGDDPNYDYLEPRGDYLPVDLDPIAGNGGSQIYYVQFYQPDRGKGGGCGNDIHSARDDEFFIIKIQWTHEHDSTYFINPRER